MKTRELENLGIPKGAALVAARGACEARSAAGLNKRELREELGKVIASPNAYLQDPIYSGLAGLLQADPRDGEGDLLHSPIAYASWGIEVEPEAEKQMENACKLPVSVKAALMPDAHVGYGLPIGGVLATENAVIPYAVGVDIACRVMMSVLDLPPASLKEDPSKFERALERETRFGVGAKFRERKTHDVLDEEWGVTAVTAALKDLAWAQLGTSGSGNHFVEFGEVDLFAEVDGIAAGRYLALVSHSGSRGPGSQVASHYSSLAKRIHRSLPKDLAHLAWLPMDGEGQEYWDAMELMGKFASANHHVVHKEVTKAVGARTLLRVENHHNFAWKETHDGRVFFLT